MKKIAFILLFGVFSLNAWAQQARPLKGTVTDRENNRIPGATVRIKGTNKGTTTDANGNFSLDVEKGQTLEFSSVGMQKIEIKVGESANVAITLESDSRLEEVIVVGYGRVKRKDLTGAVASVTGKDLQADIAKSAASALQGRIAGVTVSNSGGQPGAGMSINIRGLSSLGSNTPLYVIDGVYGDMNMVDPADIASIEVLKDASAAAIYGARAANGVVLVTTKSGRKDMAPTVNINALTGVQNVTRKLGVLDAQQWKTVMKQSGYLPQEAVDFQGEGTNWQDEVYRSAPISKLNLSVAGGTARSTYNLSAGYINQKGVILNSGFKSYNIRAKNTFNFLNDHVRLGSTILLRNSNKQINSMTITDALRQNPLMTVYNPNQLGGYTGISPWMKNMDNPVGRSMLFNEQQHVNELLVNGYAEVDLFVKGLKYKFNLGINRNNGRNYNANVPYDFGSGSYQSRLAEGAFFNNQWLAENTLHYDNEIGNHNISAVVGYAAQKNSNRGFGASRLDVPFGTDAINAGPTTQQSTNGSLQENALVSMFGRVMYSYDSKYLFSASVRRDGSSRFAPGHQFGVFPSVSVGWNVMNENFFAPLKNSIDELKIRASYGVLGNQEIGNYTTQSISTSGINYIQGGTWWMGTNTGVEWVALPQLTWEETKTSNIGLDASFLKGKLTLNADYFIKETDGVLLNIGQPGSTGIKGSPPMNAGIIRNTGYEVLVNYRSNIGQVNYSIGVNGSTAKNKVKAITVSSTIQEFGGYNPQGEGTVTWAKVGYPIGSFFVTKTDGLFQSQDEVNAHVGKDGKLIQPDAKPGDIRYIDFNGDGKIGDDDRQFAGSPFPSFMYGIRGSLEYKGVDFGFFFDGMTGNKIYNYTRARMESMNEYTNFGKDVLNAWTETNRNTDMPRFTQEDKNKNARRVSDRWLESGNFLRLKTLELGYSLPNTLVQKARFRDARVYAAMDNAFTITKYKGYSPDLGQNNEQNGGGGGTMTRGTDHGRFPLARTIMVGLQVNF